MSCDGCACDAQGPTLTMQIHEYSLMKDVTATLLRPRQPDSMWKAPPLVVMNNFAGASGHCDTHKHETLFCRIHCYVFWRHMRHSG